MKELDYNLAQSFTPVPLPLPALEGAENQACFLALIIGDDCELDKNWVEHLL